MQGLYLEDFEVGRKFEHALRRTVTEMDNTLFSCLTHNPQPLHIDHDFAAKTEWGKPLVNSLFTLGVMIGISVNDTTLGTTVGNLGMTDVKFPKPVFHGDTLQRHDRGAVQARDAVAPRRRHRRVPAQGLQPAGRAGGRMPAPGDDAQAAEGLSPMRSLLFIPADDEKKLGKGVATGADALILDLEDAVSAAAQGAPRARSPPSTSPTRARSRGGRASTCASTRSTPACWEDDLAGVIGAPARRHPAAQGRARARTCTRSRSRCTTRRSAPACRVGATRIIALVTEMPISLLQLHTYVGSSTRLEA